MQSIVVTKFGGILIYGGCVPGPLPGLLLTDPEVGPDVVNGSSEMSSNTSGLIFYCILEDGFEISIIPEVLTIAFLVCCVHKRLIQEVCDS